MIYIAGKITGLPFDETYKKFERVEKELRALDLQVINPLKLGISTTWPYEEQLAKCIEVIDMRATAIFMLSDWMDSDGAKREFIRVSELNKRGRGILIYQESTRGMNEVINDVKDGVLKCIIPNNH